MSNILRNVTLERCSRRKDKSVSINFVTQLEESPEGLMEIDKLLNDSGVLYFKSNGSLTKEEIKALESAEIEVEGKSKSQRLRNVLYIYHQQTFGQVGNTANFNDFYSNEMEKIIEHYKSKLEPNN